MSLLNSLASSVRHFHNNFVLYPVLDSVISYVEVPGFKFFSLPDDFELINKQDMLAMLALKNVNRAFNQWKDAIFAFQIAKKNCEDTSNDKIIRFEYAQEYKIDTRLIDAAAKFLRDREDEP